MSSEKDNVLELNEYTKLHKMPYIVYSDLESLIKKKYVDMQIIQKNFQQQN